MAETELNWDSVGAVQDDRATLPCAAKDGENFASGGGLKFVPTVLIALNLDSVGAVQDDRATLPCAAKDGENFAVGGGLKFVPPELIALEK